MPFPHAQMNDPEAVRARTLSNLPGVSHGFFTRRGGISTGIYASLNCGPGSKDKAHAVEHNRKRVMAALGADALNTAYQIHSAEVLVADGPWPTDSPRPRADAIVTATPGLAVGALSADCTPVLFADPDARIVAAAHAGWRGAVKGILTATIDKMIKMGASRSAIRAAIGPCINVDAYEVGHQFKADLLSLSHGNDVFFYDNSKTGIPHFDLPGFVAAQLKNHGMTHIERLTTCTWSNPDQFFSYRRSRQNNEPDYGRQISAIVLT